MGCNKPVIVKCDNCNKELKPNYVDYINHKKEDGTYYCNSCASILFGSIKQRKRKLDKSTSFYSWCKENNKNILLELWDYDLNLELPSDITFQTSKKYYFKCPRGIHKSELKSIQDITGVHQINIKCNACNSFAQWGIDNICEDFLVKYWDYDKNVVDPWEISCGNSNKKVWIKCQEKDYHRSYDVLCNAFTKGNRCSFCRMLKIHKYDSLGYLFPKVLEIWSDKNNKSPYEYSPNSSLDVYWKCPNKEHPDYIRNIRDSNRCDFRCPKCVAIRKESFIQEKVRTYLESLNYILLHEYNCSLVPHNPKIKSKLGRMPYDNEVVNLKLIIEVHGEQHYNITNYHNLQAKRNNTTAEYELHYQRLKDRYKKYIAFINGYHYLEIPYWSIKNDLYKTLINNKLSEIKEINDLQCSKFALTK